MQLVHAVKTLIEEVGGADCFVCNFVLLLFLIKADCLELIGSSHEIRTFYELIIILTKGSVYNLQSMANYA